MERTVPRLGVMLVGWGGNNGSTVTAGVLANRLCALCLKARVVQPVRHQSDIDHLFFTLFMQQHPVGDQRRMALAKLLGLRHAGIHLPRWQLQWRGVLRALQ